VKENGTEGRKGCGIGIIMIGTVGAAGPGIVLDSEYNELDPKLLIKNIFQSLQIKKVQIAHR
jgi:hypothetical protein